MTFNKDITVKTSYYSYFEMEHFTHKDKLRKSNNFLDIAIQYETSVPKQFHAIEKTINNLEAAVMYLMAADTMMRKRLKIKARETFYKTLDIIQQTVKTSQEIKVASVFCEQEIHDIFMILCLRCKSLTLLRLYQLNKDLCTKLNQQVSSLFNISDVNKDKNKILNGKISKRTENILRQQSEYFNYLCQSHDTWDEADILLYRQLHSKYFFYNLNSPVGILSFHSTVFEVFHYIQAAIYKIKKDVLLE